MTNGEMIQKVFNCEVCEPIVEDDIVHVVFADKKDSAIGFDWSWWNAEYEEPTSKNDLGVDAVSRAEVKKIAKEMYLEVANMKLDVKTISDCISYTSSKCREVLERKLQALPSVTPQEPRWIPVSERLPEEHICDDGFHEPSKLVLVQMKSGAMHTARYWSRYDERWLDLHYPTTDEVIAWMPLPKPYKAESEK